MSVQLTPSKRSYDENDAEVNGKGKLQKSEGLSSQDSNVKVLPAGYVIKVLCPVSRMNSVIGDDGNTISQIRQESGVNIQVEEIVPGCDETVIIISGSDKDGGMGSERCKADGNEIDNTEKGDNTYENDNNEENKQSVLIENSQTEKGDNTDENDNNEENKPSVLIENLRAEKVDNTVENDNNEEIKRPVPIETENNDSSVHKALLLLFEKIVGGQEINGGEESDNKSPSHIMRLIVRSSQVSGLLGKNGSIIKKMSSESGAEIKILPRDELPLCASSADDLVQISGELDEVRKALQSVCKQLLEGSLNQDSLSDAQLSRDFSLHSCRKDKTTQSDNSFRGQGPPSTVGYRDGERGFPAKINPPDILAFRLLCPKEKVGGLIGKGGTTINALQHETGCEIKVLEGVADLDDCVIVISCPAHPEDRISAAIDAVLRVHSKISRAGPESGDRCVTAKLLVSCNKIGCLLGKGGSVISGMRKSSGANIRILGKEHIPKSASENEEVILINGEPEAVHEALVQITTRLQDRFFRDAFPSNPAFSDQITPSSSYGGRRGFYPPGIYHNMIPPFHKDDAVGGFRPRGSGHPLDGLPPFGTDFRAPAIPGKRPSSAPWGPQGMIDGGRPMGFPDYPGAPPRRIGEFDGGNHPAIITSTTMEVVVPHSVVPAIYGEDGGCLRQIREISDAKITITDTRPGATETVIIISGTPEETNAAQSLIQAFVISETEAP